MKRAGTVLTILVAALAAAVPAHAGSYQVVSCKAPGAGGANNAWVPTVHAFNNDVSDADRANYTVAGSCGAAGDGLHASTAADRRLARFLTWETFDFQAPSGATITHLRVWRYGAARRSTPDSAGDGSGEWEVFAQDGSGNPIGGALGPDQCKPASNTVACSTGAPAFGPASQVDWDVATNRVSYGILCGTYDDLPRNCYTADGIGPGAFMVLQGAVVTISDSSAPSASVAGSLTGDGWRSAGGTVDWKGSDNVGVRRARLLLDGAEVSRTEQSCNFTLRVPCPASASGSLGLGGRIPRDGVHQLSLVVEDTAGNVASVDRSVAIDGHAPVVGRPRVTSRAVTVPVHDRGSGIASSSVEIRDRPGAAWRTLPSAVQDGKLVAALATGSLRGKGIRITIADAVGNATGGEIAALRLRARGHVVRRGRVSIPFGRSVVVSGRLRTLDGAAVAGATVDVSARPHRAGTPYAGLTTQTTGARGGFAFFVPKGVARQLRLRLSGAGTLPRAVTVLAGVRASSTIHASRTRLSGPGRVRFSGRLRRAGAAVPKGGAVVELQGFDRGRWRTFATARARGTAGRWHASNRFSGRPGTYPVHVVVLRSRDYPFERGASRAVRVRVG